MKKMKVMMHLNRSAAVDCSSWDNNCDRCPLADRLSRLEGHINMLTFATKKNLYTGRNSACYEVYNYFRKQDVKKAKLKEIKKL